MVGGCYTAPTGFGMRLTTTNFLLAWPQRMHYGHRLYKYDYGTDRIGDCHVLIGTPIKTDDVNIGPIKHVADDRAHL